MALRACWDNCRFQQVGVTLRGIRNANRSPCLTCRGGRQPHGHVPLPSALPCPFARLTRIQPYTSDRPHHR